MNSWQMKALELEMSALKYLDGVIADYGLYLFVGFVYLLIPFTFWALRGGLRRKLSEGKPMPCIRPTVVIYVSEPPPRREEPFIAFPPYHEPPECDCDERSNELRYASIISLSRKIRWLIFSES